MTPLLSAAAGFLIVLVVGLLIGHLLMTRSVQSEPLIDPQSLIQPLPVPARMIRTTSNDVLLTWDKPFKVIRIEVDSLDANPLIFEYPPHNRLQLTRSLRSRPVATLHVRDGVDSTRPVVVSERNLQLKKGINVRDIGGYFTEDGRQVRWNRVFRAGDLSRLSEGDQGHLQQLGLRLICDLRSQHEVEERQDVVPEGVTYRHLPLNDGAGPTRRYFSRMLVHRGRPHALMQDIYLTVVRERTEALRDWFDIVADPDNLPVLAHCTAGKDRTGIVIALLLGVLGVPKETIFADYTQSNLHFEQLFAAFQLNSRQALRLGIPASAFRTVLLAHPDWLEAAWAYILDRHLSIEAYLLDEVGVSEAAIAQIRQNLLY